MITARGEEAVRSEQLLLIEVEEEEPHARTIQYKLLATDIQGKVAPSAMPSAISIADVRHRGSSDGVQ